jgi:ferrous iron transport protein A
MADLVRLSALPVGSQAIIRKFVGTNSARIRLREMGMLAGTELTFVRKAPLGDPIEIKVRGYRLTLRKTEAEFIMVEPSE